MNVGSLFTGIGGFDLGLERAGMRVVWQCEQDEYRRAVLRKHWPGVPCYPDVRALVADSERRRRDWVHERVEARHLAADVELGGQDGTDGARPPDSVGERQAGQVSVPVPPVDVLCGGFPCQDLSLAGKGAGIDGQRSGLWAEFARLVGELRPRYVIVENVPALLARGMGRVVGDLAACGYDAEWDCLPASAFGAPHRRDRVWVVAYPQQRELRLQPAGLAGGGGAPVVGDDGAEGDVAYPEGQRWRGGEQSRQDLEHDGPELAHGDAGEGRDGGWWAVEPDVGRVAHGVPSRVDRLAALGDALVPQVAEWIGRRLMAYEQAEVAA